jgi:lysine biosynthesis protein LysW
MKCICPECKNDIDLSVHPKAAVGYIVECPTCGIVLEIRSLDGAEAKLEIVDEGK